MQGKINIKKDITATYRRKMRSKSLLAGVLFYAQDKLFTLISCSKGKVQFKYYFVKNGVHIPVTQLDELVLNTMRRIDLSGVDIQANFSQISFGEAKKAIYKVICVKVVAECRSEIKLHKNVVLEISKQSIETETKADFLLTPEISPKYLTIRETFYIDNVSSTRF